MAASRWIVALTALAGSAAACATLLGIDDFADQDAGATSTGTGSGLGGSGASSTSAGGGGGIPTSVTYGCSWSRRFESTDHAHAEDLAVNVGGPTRSIAIGGWFVGELSLEDRTLVSQHGVQSDGYVAAFDTAGELLWAHDLGDNGNQRVYGVGVDAPFNVAAIGRYDHDLMIDSALALGNSDIEAGTAQDLFVALLASTGARIEEIGVGNGEGDQSAHGVAIDASHRVLVGGYFSDDGGAAVSFGGDGRTGSGDEGFLAQYDGALDYGWDQQLGGVGSQIVSSVAVDGNGHPIAVGGFTVQLSWGGDSRDSVGERDVFVAKADAEGTPQWLLAFGDDQLDRATAVAARGTDVVVVGDFMNSIDFDGDSDASAPLESQGSLDLFVVKIDGAGTDPTVTWSRSFGSQGDDGAYDVHVDPATGRIAITGVVERDVDFGRGVLAGDDQDAFVLVLDPDGNTLWSARYGATGLQEGRGISFFDQGSLVVHGHSVGPLDFGCGAESDAGVPDGGFPQDLFLLRLDQQ